MNRLVAFRDRQVEPAINTPFFAELLSGDPTTTAWRIAMTDDGQVSSGFWSATPAKWRMDYKVWEFCQILEGSCDHAGWGSSSGVWPRRHLRVRAWTLWNVGSDLVSEESLRNQKT